MRIAVSFSVILDAEQEHRALLIARSCGIRGDSRRAILKSLFTAHGQYMMSTIGDINVAELESTVSIMEAEKAPISAKQI